MKYKLSIILVSSLLSNAMNPSLSQADAREKKAMQRAALQGAEYGSYLGGAFSCCASATFFALSKLLNTPDNLSAKSFAECVAPKSAYIGAGMVGTGLILRQRRKQLERETNNEHAI